MTALTRTFTLADTPSLNVDMTAPLPLGYAQAVQRALALRMKGNLWTYAVISVVMAEYHGFGRAPSWWRRELRAIGATPRHRGTQLGLKQMSA